MEKFDRSGIQYMKMIESCRYTVELTLAIIDLFQESGLTRERALDIALNDHAKAKIETLKIFKKIGVKF